MRKVTQKKTLNWAGATPLFRLSAAQKVRGVAPARHRGTVTVFCPREYTDVINPKCREVTLSNTDRRKFRWHS
jgi:hypothetical protein